MEAVSRSRIWAPNQPGSAGAGWAAGGAAVPLSCAIASGACAAKSSSAASAP